MENNSKYCSMEEIFRYIKWNNYVEINTKEEADFIREYVRNIKVSFDNDKSEDPSIVREWCELLEKLFAGISTEFDYGEVNVENDYLLSYIASTIADMKREIITKYKYSLSERDVMDYQYAAKYYDLQKEKQTKLVELEAMRKKGYNKVAAILEMEIEDLDKQIMGNNLTHTRETGGWNEEYINDKGDLYKFNPTTNSYEYVEQEEQLEGKFRK